MMLLVTACSTRSPNANFYLLENGLSGDERSGTLRVGLGPVSVADYLQKPQIAIRTDSSKIIFSEFDRWASDLRGLIINAVQHDLANELNTDNIFEYPWRKSDKIDFAVSLDIKRFDASFDQASAYLEARVKLTNAQGESIARSYSLTEPLQTSSYESVVSTQRRLLSSLAEKVAFLVKKQQN
jgi:uncharacterized lipoprotein YmbA